MLVSKMQGIIERVEKIKMKRIARSFLFGAFLFYCLAVIYLLILSRQFMTFYSIPEFFELKSNLVPFKTIKSFVRVIVQVFEGGEGDILWALKQLFGNLALFLPLGVFLPIIFKIMDRFWKVFVALTITVLVAEISQTLLRVGCCDVDDLFLNVIGGIFGYLITKIPILRRTIDNIRS